MTDSGTTEPYDPYFAGQAGSAYPPPAPVQSQGGWSGGQMGAYQQPSGAGQQPYGAGQQPYGYGQAPPARSTNGLAIASMVLGILWLYWVGSVLALIFGYVARNQIKRHDQAGDGMAIAGIVLGWVGVGLFLFFVALAALIPVFAGA